MISLETDFERISAYRPPADPLRRGLDEVLDRLEHLRMDEIVRLPKDFMLPELPIAVAAKLCRRRTKPVGVIYDFVLDSLMPTKTVRALLPATPPLLCKQCGRVMERQRGRTPSFCRAPRACQAEYKRARKAPRAIRPVRHRAPSPFPYAGHSCDNGCGNRTSNRYRICKACHAKLAA